MPKAIPALVALLLLLGQACFAAPANDACSSGDPSLLQTGVCLLPIEDIEQSSDRVAICAFRTGKLPTVDTDPGWCGEACIQMAALYYGQNISQALINASTVLDQGICDIAEAEDMEEALHTVGLRAKPFLEETKEALYDWILKELAANHPVICGVKIPQGEFPIYDHFILFVGYSSEGLIANTNDGSGQVFLSRDELLHGAETYTFINSSNTYYAWAVTGLLD